jgi:hypothetical protein
MHLISTLSYEQNILQAKHGGVDSPNSTSENFEPAIMMHTRCRQFLLLMLDLKTLNNEEKHVKEEGRRWHHH